MRDRSTRAACNWTSPMAFPALMFLPPALPFAQVPDHWLDGPVNALSRVFPENTWLSFAYNVNGLIALVLVSLCCGAVGSLVVGSRMAFFSDALAHCAFAGVSLGFLIFYGLLARYRPQNEFWEWVTPIMVVFGCLVGLGIAYVRSRTGLSSDTVIGVFFASSIGLAALLRKVMQDRKLFNLEDFLFGDPLLVQSQDLVWLAVLTLITTVLLFLVYNSLMLSSFNTSLALSRRVPVSVYNYVFVVLLALIVNLCLRCVGALLINALLIVPAATAVNLSRNLRQLFWRTVLLCLGVSVVGHWLSWEAGNVTGWRIGVPGMIVLISVALFALSMVPPLARLMKGRPRAPQPVASEMA